MDKLLEKYLNPMRAPEGGGDGGGAGDPPAAAPAAGGGDAKDPPAPAPGPGDDTGKTLPAAQAEPYFPAGFADNLKGASDRETIDNFAKALKGYRDADATRDIPKDAAGYWNHDGLADFKIPDELAPHMKDLGTDPGFLAAAEVARDAGIDRLAFNRMAVAVFDATAKAGMLEAPVDAAKERAELLPEAARTLPETEQSKAIDRRMQDNFDFVDLMLQRELARPEGERQIAKDDAEYVKMMLGDSAKGHRFLEFFRRSIAHAGIQPLGAGGAGAGNEAEQLAKDLAKPEMQPGHPKFNRASYDALMARYRAAFPG